MCSLKRQRKWIFSLLAGSALLLLTSCSQGLSKEARPGDAAGGGDTAVAAFEVTRADVIRTLLLSGELLAERSVEISCPRIRSGFSSTITYMADEGSAVRQGDRILEFDGSNLLSSKAEAERKLDEAKLKIQKTAADLEAQRCDLLDAVSRATGALKIAKLYGQIPKELLPINDFERYQTDLERANLALEKATEQLSNLEATIPAQIGLVEVERAQAELDLRKIESDLKMLQVYAPQNGIVIYGDNWRENRKVQVGDAVFPGMPVISLPDLSSMQIEGYVYDTELRFLSPGMSCRFGLDAIPGRTWEGRIVSLTSVAGRKGFASDHKVFKATIELAAQDPVVMRPGMTARVEIPVTMASNAIVVPRAYVGLDAHENYYVVKSEGQNRTAVASVEIGANGDDWLEVQSGVEEGEVLLPPSAAREASK